MKHEHEYTIQLWHETDTEIRLILEKLRQGYNIDTTILIQQLSESDSFAPRSTLQDYSSTSSTLRRSSIVVLTQEYDQLWQLEFSQNKLSATHTSASGMHAYTVSPQKPWILDSGVTSHMTGIIQKFVLLNMSIAPLC